LSFSPNGKRLATGRYDGSVSGYDLSTYREVPAPLVAFAPYQLTATAEKDESATRWEIVVRRNSSEAAPGCSTSLNQLRMISPGPREFVRTMDDDHADRMYDVALSFAGEDRAVVEEFAKELRERGISVFYDKFEEAELWGKDLYDYLSEVYSKRCNYCVVFVSRAYATKDWTRLERRSAQSRSLREQREFLLPVRLDDTELPGLLSNVACVDLRTRRCQGWPISFAANCAVRRPLSCLRRAAGNSSSRFAATLITRPAD
jgi:hypothetical protein